MSVTILTPAGRKAFPRADIYVRPDGFAFTASQQRQEIAAQTRSIVTRKGVSTAPMPYGGKPWMPDSGEGGAGCGVVL